MQEQHSRHVTHSLDITYVCTKILIGKQDFSERGRETLNLFEEVIKVGEGSRNVFLNERIYSLVLFFIIAIFD